jgi:hypothetical protein
MIRSTIGLAGSAIFGFLVGAGFNLLGLGAEAPAAVAAPAPCVERDAGLQLERAVEALQAKHDALQALTVAAGMPEAPPWPKDVPEVLSQEGFESALDHAVPEDSVFSVALVDCSEPPCLAFLTTTSSGDGWLDHKEAIRRGLTDQAPDDLVSMSMDRAVRTEEGVGRTVAISLVSMQEVLKGDVSPRLYARMRAGLRDAMPDAWLRP